MVVLGLFLAYVWSCRQLSHASDWFVGVDLKSSFFPLLISSVYECLTLYEYLTPYGYFFMVQQLFMGPVGCMVPSADFDAHHFYVSRTLHGFVSFISRHSPFYASYRWRNTLSKDKVMKVESFQLKLPSMYRMSKLLIQQQGLDTILDCYWVLMFCLELERWQTLFFFRKPCKVGIRYLEDGSKVRVSRGIGASGSIIPRPEILKIRTTPRPTVGTDLKPSAFLINIYLLCYSLYMCVCLFFLLFSKLFCSKVLLWDFYVVWPFLCDSIFLYLFVWLWFDSMLFYAFVKFSPSMRFHVSQEALISKISCIGNILLGWSPFF